MDVDALAELRARRAEAVFDHAAKGLWVRYGIGITPTEYLRLCQALDRVLPRLHVRPSGSHPGRCCVIYPV
ncbi:hypothetical protein [Deinococcus multiflagellatus]|uniref:Uncharacterized protein n=1 Tax=Deinococcus multiflagellatus TaxID=1656887 RepID=A0ABW1ZEQ2_9DEIO|nr:hypothetical protein [Deinococcus multiflagellatus]MBZ9712207.1 hypothetical protein [Deinococcus multiflagellatus]